jgi:hypothetical protein
MLRVTKGFIMSVASFLLGVWLILVGVTWLTWVTIDIKFLGLLGFITGLVWLIEGAAPFYRKQRQ